jgi:hypothetical protein
MISDCRITDCLLGSAAIGADHSGGQILRCEIVGNRLYFVEQDGGGIQFNESAFEVIDCLFADNPGECLRIYACNPIAILGSTLTENEGGMGGRGAMSAAGSDITITRSILWSNGSHPGVNEVFLSSGTLQLVCCALDSAVVHSEGVITYDGEQVFSDPMFCDPDQGDYTLRADSPCLPANSPCGDLIGASARGCEP